MQEPSDNPDRLDDAVARSMPPAGGDSAALPRTWQSAAAAWLGVELATVEENLALDEALLELAHEGLAATACVRTWMATKPAVVLGSSGRLAAEVDLEACAAHGVGVVRRPSGGGTVLLGPGCLMWSVIVPHPAGSPPIEAIHASILAPLAASLTAHLGLLDAGGAAAATWAGAAVTRWGTSDLAVVQHDTAMGPGKTRAGGSSSVPARKVSGTALRVRRHGVLYHGTLLDSFDLGLVARVLRHPPREPDYRGGRSHGDFLANLGLGRSTLERLVRQAFGAAAEQSDWPRDRVARLVRDRYTAAAWTERL